MTLQDYLLLCVLVLVVAAAILKITLESHVREAEKQFANDTLQRIQSELRNCQSECDTLKWHLERANEEIRRLFQLESLILEAVAKTRRVDGVKKLTKEQHHVQDG